MKVEGERTFAAPRQTVWGVLQDPAQMAALMPRVESFDVEDDRRWKANVKIPLGLGSLKMSIKFEKLEEREPEFSRLQAKGTGRGRADEPRRRSSTSASRTAPRPWPGRRTFASPGRWGAWDSGCSSRS